MRIRLCYKDYDIKMTLGAMKLFAEDTGGRDMWTTALQCIATNQALANSSLCDRFIGLGRVLTFLEASHFLHRITSAANSAIGLDEIQDAMFHSGMIPSDDDDLQPWQLVLLHACFQIREEIDQNATLKKK